ncbi:hypothetical protein IC582_027281 [Cucumis melo]|uniref:MADS-box transcription factor 8-like n=1 Tax=Cucumis melo TaxID=3656 RepID=A0A1S3CCC5_CUCME|nr:MADS-box transcription factor 8-like [Cucumis melo]
MGRKKIEVKLIEDRCNRHVTFCKRRSGLLKKARELSVLCDVEVGIILFTNRGRLYEFCSGNSLLNIIMRYQSHLQGRNESPIDNDLQGRSESLIDSDAKDHVSDETILDVSDETILVSLKKQLQTIQSQVEEPNFKKLDITQMVQLENQLEGTLDKIKSQRIEAMIENDDCWTYDMEIAMGMINSPPFN